MTAGPPSEALIALGRVGRPHGIRGEITFLAYNRASTLPAEVPHLRAADGRVFTVKRARRSAQPGRWILALEGVGDRNAAAALTHTELGLLRTELPEPADGWYLVDLIGLEVVDLEGRPLGQVEGVEEAGATDLLVVRRGEGRWLLPATRPLLVEVDGEAGRLVTDLPEGLAEP